MHRQSRRRLPRLSGRHSVQARAGGTAPRLRLSEMCGGSSLPWRASYFCCSYQAAIARISSSENPLAIRSMMVPGRWPDLNAIIWLVRSAAGRPASGGTGVSTRGFAAWQPEQEAAPAGISAADAAIADASTIATTTVRRIRNMCKVRKMGAAVPSGPPPFCFALSHRDVVVLQRERADAFPGRLEVRVHHRRRRDADGRLADPAPRSRAA